MSDVRHRALGNELNKRAHRLIIIMLPTEWIHFGLITEARLKKKLEIGNFITNTVVSEANPTTTLPTICAQNRINGSEYQIELKLADESPDHR